MHRPKPIWREQRGQNSSHFNFLRLIGLQSTPTLAQ
jgi:hypothetical protein